MHRYNRDLFIVCSGECASAAERFCNLMLDLGGKWTAGKVADAEEA